MPTTSSTTNSIRKPFTANKRLLGLLMAFIIVIGGLLTVYYYHTKSNEQNFREVKLLRLNSFFDLIDKQLNNKVQTFNSKQKNDAEKICSQSTSTTDLNEPFSEKIWSDARKIATNFSLNVSEFDHYILIIKNLQWDKDDFKTKKDSVEAVRNSVIYQSCLKGSQIPPDSLFQSDILNIGVSMAIPKEKPEYQLFGKTYRYESRSDSFGKPDSDTLETVTNTTVEYEIKIIGLIEADQYQESIKKLDPWIIALLTTFLLLSLFGLPYFKMLFIAEDERLSGMDVIASGISVVVGTPIMVVIFLSLMDHYHTNYEIVPDRLKVLSKDIGKRFEKENRENVYQLSKMSLLDIEGKDKQENEQDRRFTKDSCIFVDTLGDRNELLRHFKFISKINDAGKALYHIALINKHEIKNTKSLASRPYYTDYIASKNRWVSDTNPNLNYVMRPVVSVEDQAEEAVYILKNEADKIPGFRVGSSHLKSIYDPILPFGYQFAIVDELGEVWFHSEEGRATLENLFKVSRRPERLKAAIQGRINAGGLLNYREKSKLFNVTPISGTNLSVVALYDVGLIRARVSEVLTLASMAIILAFLLMLVLIVLSLVIRNPKLGLFKYDRFLFEFLTPQKEKRDNYILLSVLFFTTLLIGILISCLTTLVPAKAYVMCLLVAMWAYLIVYYTLHPYRNRRDVKFRLRDFLLVSVIIFLNVILMNIDPMEPQFSIPAIVLQMGLIGYFILGQVPRDKTKRTRFQRQISLMTYKVKRICRYNPFKVHMGYKYWYTLFLFSWLLLAAVYPAILMFEKAHDINDQVWYKADQIFMAKKFMQKEKRLSTNLPSYPGYTGRFKLLYEEHLKDAIYPNSIKISKDTENHIRDTVSNSYFREFIWRTRPLYDKRLIDYQALAYEIAQDSSWTSKESSTNSSFNLQYMDQKNGVIVQGYNGDHFMGVTRGFRLWEALGTILLLAILLSLILFFVDRFFGFRFRHLQPNDFDADEKHHYIKKFSKLLLDEASNNGLLLIGLPFSGRLKFARKVISTARVLNVATLSMLRLDSIDIKAKASEILKILTSDFNPENRHAVTWEDKDVFIIEHLEHNIKSFEANHAKLKLISFLISEKKKIILISEVYPSQIFALYENPPQNTDLPWGSFEDDFNSWRNILSAFPQIMIGITENKDKVNKLLNLDPRSADREKKKTLEPLVNELGYSQFLPTLAPIIAEKTVYKSKQPMDKREWLDRQRMVMQTQNLSHGYYNDIWNALPTRERYMLYDLAKDGFLNIKNRNSLFSLMKKGLIVWRNRPRIFNDSFKNFIYTSVSLNEALRLEKRNQASGSWGNIRILFYLIIAATIAFIAMGKPEILEDFEAIVGALGGLGVVIPLVSKLLASSALK